MSYPDEFDALHKSLVNDAKHHPEYANNQVSGLYGYSEGVEHALDTVRQQGYVKPRTITTTAELDALRTGSVILTAFGQGVSIYRNELIAPDAHHYAVAYGPATVLHEPEVTA